MGKVEVTILISEEQVKVFLSGLQLYVTYRFFVHLVLILSKLKNKENKNKRNNKREVASV